MLDTSVDFIILFAVEDEFLYFTNFIKPDFAANDRWHDEHIRGKSHLIGHFRVARDKSYFTVLAAQASAMGGAHSIVRAALLLREFNPTTGIAMCGVCAADKQPDLGINLGDVIAPRKIYYRSYGKLIGSTEVPSWDTKNQKNIPDPASGFGWPIQRSNLKCKFPVALNKSSPPENYNKTIEDFTLHTDLNLLTTDNVTVDEDFFKTINDPVHHNIRALDMEAYHLALLAEEFELKFVLMKGVQDYAGPAIERGINKKHDLFREFACCSSGKLLIEYLRNLFINDTFKPRYIDKEVPKSMRFEKALKAKPFLSWLHEKNSLKPFPPALNHHNEQLSSKGINPQHHCRLANTVVVESSGSKDSPFDIVKGYSNIEILRGGSYDINSLIEDLPEDVQLRFLSHLEKRLKGVKGTPVAFYPPISESTMKFDIETIDYNSVHALHSLLYNDATLQAKLSKQAFRLLDPIGSKGVNTLPGILTLDAVVITQDRYIVLGHRKPRPDGYYAHTWSASFEEQFSAIENPLEDRIIPRDRTVRDAVLRGLKEEILAYSLLDEARIDITLHALYLDLVLLNWQLLSVIKLDNITFPQLYRSWVAPGEVPDKAEHDYLWGLKANPTFLEKAVYSDGLSGLELFSEEALVQNCPASVVQELMSHKWQPRSQVRLACVWWMLESGLL